MVNNRARKMDSLAGEMDEPDIYGDPHPEKLLIGWGSTYGCIREAVDALAALGIKTAMLHFSDIWPLPRKRLVEMAAKVDQIYCIENNTTGQLSTLIRRETGIVIDRLILKYDGRPFLPHEIVKEVECCV
jgi:2-oxoglutarate/2-oxoacid ferredoxin oxidoreductase subunit alpha